MSHLLSDKIDRHLPQRQTWQLVIRTWAHLMDRYVEWEKDLPYWNTERSLVGFLAGAAWTLGGTALEEYTTTRQRIGAGGRRKAGSGRGDLYIDIGKDFWWVIEAKLTRPQQASPEAVDEVKSELEAATVQLRSIRREDREGCRMMAICFVAPDLLDGPAVQDALKTLTSSLRGDVDIIARYQVKPEERSISRTAKRIYPGVLLVGRTVTR